MQKDKNSKKKLIESIEAQIDSKYNRSMRDRDR